VQSVYERDRKLGEFLEKLGIRPKAEIAVSRRNYDDTLSLATPSGKVSLGQTAAEKVWVSPANSSPSASRQKKLTTV
jgi:Fe2+ transport system protein FeoA